MKILFVSPAIEEKSRGIGAIFRSLVESAKQEGHEVNLVLGYPASRPLGSASSLSDKLEHLHAQHYLQDGRDSFKNIAKRPSLKLSILESIATLSILRTSRTKVSNDLLKGPKSLLNNSDYFIRSPYFYIVLNHLPRFMSQMVLNRMVRKYDIDLVVLSAPTTIYSKKTPAKVAHFIHDTMPFELIEAPMDKHTPVRYAKQFHTAVQNSDLIFTNSKDTATKVKEANKDANVHVLYGTASSRRADVEPGSIVERKKLPPNNYLLFTSTLEKRKNVSRLMKAYAKIHDELGMPLVLVGAQGYGYDEIHKDFKSLPAEVRKDVKILGYVTEADKFQLFDNAFAFVFPSLYEGMGLMLIEAMQAEIPIITANRGALPEAGGKAAIYIDDPYDTEEIASAILKLKNDPALAKELVAQGKKQRNNFTFDNFRKRFAKALKSIG